MKIAIIENERKQVEGALDYLNYKHYANSLHFEYYETSQDFFKNDINQFVLIIIDIHLTKKSELDGFGVIERLLQQSQSNVGKILILTGFFKVDERLEEKGLPSFPIVVKPTDFNELFKVFKDMGIHYNPQ